MISRREFISAVVGVVIAPSLPKPKSYCIERQYQGSKPKFYYVGGYVLANPDDRTIRFFSKRNQN